MARSNQLTSLSNEALVGRFEELAIIHGELRTAEEANRAFEEAAGIWCEISERGAPAIDLFLQLLESGDPMVRLAAAAKALFVAPGKAEPVLELLRGQTRNIGLTAFMTLKEWRAGRLKPPR